MAGGTCTDKPGIFDNVKKEWSYHRQCQFKNKLDNKLLSDIFYKRRKVEYKRTCTRNISLFQKNIFRILTGCYYTDLYIIHDTNVIKTNCCIFKTRSPSLYNVLEFFFVKNGKPIKCYLNTVQAFQRIDNFIRLLYINTDISSEENTLLKFFSNEKNCIKSELIKSNENDISTSSLEMADSGLETGSLSLNENTESENSGTDIEESHVSDYIPTNDGFIRLNCDADKLNDKNISTKENKCIDSKACGSSSLMARQFDQKYLSGNNGDDDEEEDEEEEITTCDNVDDVSRYENEVLNDIFYESDGNDNEQSASFVQTGSFEFIEPENLSSLMPTNGATKKNITTVDISKEFISENNYQDEKTSTIPQTRSMIVENIQHELSHSNDNSLNKSLSNVNNYYFIDASSLNDETEIASITSTSQQPIYMESLNYIPSKSHNSNDQMNKIISRSSSSSSHQCGHDEIAEFQRELKLTETLEPLVEQRKVKRVDSITDDKKIEKELLVVEIKEADSGESNHPSPCIDNNKRLQQCENNSNIINENINDSRRSSLIRGNTFELEPGDKKLTNARQEHERRQGNLVFSNSIPQYSGHRVDGDSVSDRTSNYSSMSSYFPHDASSSSNNSIDKLKYQRTNYHDFMSYDGNLNNFNDPKYPMIKSASDKLLVDCTEINDNTIGDCISLPMTFDDHSHFGSIKKTKCDETTPIVSGGACTNDYSQSVIDSPVIIRRKTESTPIVSGGSIIMTPSPPSTTTATSSTQDKIKSINRLSSSMTTWVVDMSDCTKTNEKSNPTSPNMSKSLSTNESCSSSKQINHTKTPDKPNSLGFFINLNDIDKPSMSKTITTTTKKDQNFINKQSFFIDLSSGNNDDKKIKKYQNNISNDCGKLQHDKNEKKNIFSMFIDLNDTKGVKSNEREIKSLNSLHQGHCSITDDDIGKSDSSKELRSSTDKKSVFMFIESDSPVVRRRTLSTSRPAFKRHSWNMEKSHQQITTTNGNSNGNSNGNGNGHIRREHKRAHSVSIDPDIHMKLSAKKSDSSMSLNNIGKTNSLNIPETSQEIIQSELNNDQIYYEIRDTPPNSHIEIINDDLRGRVMNQEYKELVRSDCMYSSTDASCDAKILDDERSDISMWEKTPTESTDCHTRKSETFDISSGGGSGPSPESDNNDFDLIEYHSDIINQVDQLHTTKISETHKSLTEKIKKIECEFDDDKLKIMSKSDNTKDKKQQASCSGFVRLSDLDKTPTDDSIKATTTLTTTTTTATNNISYRMSKSIPETSWIESKLAVNRTIIGPCQIRTLSSRKYSTIMSTSLPAKNNKSPTDEFTSSALNGGDGGGGGNEMPSESDLSSMQSSMAKSCASTEETETSSIIATKPYNRLGEDLLRMFIEEINPDVTIDVGGRRIRAHKCILSSRCQYFAAILSGSWIENAGNVITLKGYSYNSVHFALCHIYSGESNIPDTISIVELATLADMLCLEGLKEIIGYTLKVKYCHLFHKPCQICTVGVLECMPLAAAYGLDEVYRKSLRWITRHFVRIWPCKAFASLPKELMDKCYQQHIVHMSADNILQTIMDCDKLLATLPNVRWAEPVFRMVSNLLEISLKYLSDNFSSILGNDNFQALGKDLTWNISRLEDNILSCADKLLPDQACKSYSRISKMISSIPSDDSIIKPQWNFLFIELLKKIKIRVEKCLIKDAARAARTTTWLKMDLELRRKIQELACLVILPNETIKRPTRHSNFIKDIKTPPNRTSTSRSLDLRRVKMTITDQIDLKTTTTTIKSNISQIKNIMTKPKTDPLERKMQTTKIGQTIEANIRPKSWPNKLEVKSRYLEPRTKSVPKENPSDKTIVQQRRKNLISSSDSSRTSSPAMKRAVAAAAAVAVNANKKPITRLKMSIKKDVKALSTDSLTETSTNNKSKKKDTLSKSCGITRPESPSLKSKNSTIDIDISTDSLADIKKKPITTTTTTTTRKNGKMDNSISADSLDQHKTPKTNIAIKKSPILNKTTTTTGGKSQILERTKKSLSSSPPINQKNPLSLSTKRPARSIESSTAASRNRAAATTTIYHGSPSLRRNLLDAAKTPDIPSKNSNGISSKINSRQSTPSTSTPTSIKKDIFNPPRSESPNKKSPKLNGTTTTTSTTRPTRPINAGKKTLKGIEDKLKNKCLVAETLGSRSGTFLKDEPTVLKKSDMKSTQVTS